MYFKVLLYDLRSSRPFLVKDHNFGLPIKDIEFHESQNLVMSCDSRILKLWDVNSVVIFSTELLIMLSNVYFVGYCFDLIF